MRASLPPPSETLNRSGPRAAEPDRTGTVAVLVFPRFPMMAFSSVIEPLRAANSLAGHELYRWLVVGPDAQPVTASNRISISPDHGVGSAPLVDRIVVCSGGDADHVVSDEAIAWIRRCLRNGASVGAVADGAFFLARAGLLDGYPCTLHWTSQPAFREAFPELDLRRDLYVIEGRRFTSAGGVGSLDMMLEIIGTDAGAEIAAGVAEWFVHSPLRSSVDRRLMPVRLRTGVRDELVLSAIAIMEEEVEDRLSMASLAQRLGVSDDKLERSFRAELDASPAGYYRRLRLRRAADLLSHSTLPVRDVAMACGFASMSSFARAFRGEHGLPPSDFRRRQ